MMLITIAIDYPGMEPQGIKEALAMDCERYGRGGQGCGGERD